MYTSRVVFSKNYLGKEGKKKKKNTKNKKQNQKQKKKGKKNPTAFLGPVNAVFVWQVNYRKMVPV